MDEIDLTRAEAHRAVAAAIDARPVERPQREPERVVFPPAQAQRRRADLHAIEEDPPDWHLPPSQVGRTSVR